MLSVRYTDGTTCDINSNQPRETIVYYSNFSKQKETDFLKNFYLVCDERGNDGILNFEEISTCYYEMTVASRWLCKLPTFR
jgi:hypothetical protein